MNHLLVLFVHLLATCTAIGAIVATDARLIGRFRRADFRLAPPTPFVARLVGASLVVLCLSGAWLVAEGLAQRPDALANPKLQVKLALVALLCLNAAYLHKLTFPWLERGRRASPWAPRVALGVALPIAVSNALWLFAAFLGIARPWNHTMPASTILTVAGALVGVSWLGVMAVLILAAQRQRAPRTSADGRSLPPDPSAVRQASEVLGRVRQKSLEAPTQLLERHSVPF